MYFCRHDQFAASPARQMVPIQPDWLIDALGVSTFDPSLPHQGPYPLPDGRLEIRTIKETPEGTITKRTILDASQGWVLGRKSTTRRATRWSAAKPPAIATIRGPASGCPAR